MGDFTPLNQVGNYIISNLQTIGWIIAGVVVVILAIILITSGGNEQRIQFVMRAGVYLVIGILLLVGAMWVVNTLRSISTPLQPAQPQQQQQQQNNNNGS